MSNLIDDVLSLVPNARPGRVPHNVFDITVPLAEDAARKAAIGTLRIFGADAIAYHVYDTFGEVRVRITFRPGDVEPLIYYNKLRDAS